MCTDDFAVQVVLAAPAPRHVPIRAQAWTRGFVLLLMGRQAWWRLCRCCRRHALVVWVNRRRDYSVLIYGQFAFLPLPPHQKYEPQLDPLSMCDSIP
jgi:hypothetical protein